MLATVAWIGILGWQAAYTPTQREKDECYETAKKSGHKTEECKTLWERTTSDPIAFFTFSLFLVTGVLAIATVRLWNSTAELADFAEEQSRDMKDSLGIARSSMIASTRAASAAERSTKISEEAFRRLERPYLFVKIIETFRLQNPEDAQPSITYTLVNYGKTPAILRSIAISFADNPKWPLRTPAAIAEEFYEIIPPGGELNNPRGIPVEDSERGKRYSGADATLLTLHGLLEYEDATGALHLDSFCLRANASASTFRVAGGAEKNWRKTKYPKPESE